MGIAVAPTDPALAEQLYRIAKPIYDHSAHGGAAVTRIDGLGFFYDISLRTVALAGLLNKKDPLDAMLAELSEVANKEAEASEKIRQGPGLRVVTDPLFEVAGRVSPEFVLEVYNAIYNQEYFALVRTRCSSPR